MRHPPLLTRLRWRRRLRALAALLLLAGLAVAAWLGSPASVVAVPLVHVIDGDSLTARQDGRALTIRLVGIDAVEYRQDCERTDGTRWPCGVEARAALERLAGRGPLHCTLEGADRYRRMLAACRTALDSAESDLGAALVRQGWAIATGDRYFVEEAEARAKRRGIWQGRFVRPADWRGAHQRPKE
jgi:endonuclease YncB( thermonuclease family)